MRLFSVSMKRAPFKPLTVLTPCRSLRSGQNVTDSNTFATALFLAFNTAAGEVPGKTANCHTSAEFVGFLSQVVATQPPIPKIHIIADNLSTHETKTVEGFLSAH